MANLCLLKSTVDLCICTKSSCIKCLEAKLSTTVLKVYKIDHSALKEYKKLGIKGYNVVCENPNH